MLMSYVDQTLGQRERRGALATQQPYLHAAGQGHHQREHVRQHVGTRLGTLSIIYGLLWASRQPQAQGGHGQRADGRIAP